MDSFVRCVVYILPAAKLTLLVTVMSLAMGFVLGMLLAVARVYGGPVLRFAAASYSRVVRSLPTLVMVFALYYVVLMTDFLGGSRLASAVLALGACSTAYQSEIFRGAIQSLGSGQMLAARSLGMSRPVALRSVILPQAVRLAIPAWSNEAAIVLKDSSLVSAVGTVELFRRAEHVAAATHDWLTAFLAVGLIYFCLTFLTNRALDWVERRYRLKV